MIRGLAFLVCPLLVSFTVGCATVDVTKTAKGYFEPTRPDDVEILMTVPQRRYQELATVSTANWNPNQTAKMHNALRAKSAPLGADAVVLNQSGIVIKNNQPKMWSTGFALIYKDTSVSADVSSDRE